MSTHSPNWALERFDGGSFAKRTLFLGTNYLSPISQKSVFSALNLSQSLSISSVLSSFIRLDMNRCTQDSCWVVVRTEGGSFARDACCSRLTCFSPISHALGLLVFHFTMSSFISSFLLSYLRLDMKTSTHEFNWVSDRFDGGSFTRDARWSRLKCFSPISHKLGLLIFHSTMNSFISSALSSSLRLDMSISAQIANCASERSDSSSFA